jgi:hypothetical protein
MDKARWRSSLRYKIYKAFAEIGGKLEVEGFDIQALISLGVGGAIAFVLILKLLPRIDKMDSHNIEAHSKLCATLSAISDTLKETVGQMLAIIERKMEK